MTGPEPQGQIHEVVEHLSRHQAGQMLATLTHIFGLEHLDLAEEVVQEALLQALRQWPLQGVPSNPRAWLIQAARNKALDVLRRRTSLRRKQAELEERLRESRSGADWADAIDSESLNDEQLAMIFACCDPALAA